MSGGETLPDRIASIDIEAPIEDVWAELTRRDDVQKAMFNTRLHSDLEAGSRMHYYSPDGKYILVTGKLLEIDPPHRLVHTYRFTDLPETETTVRWELEETAQGTRVRVTHTDFTDQKKTHGRVEGGWTMVLSTLKDVVETGSISLKAKLLWWLMDALSFLRPKSARAEKVLNAEE